MARLSRLGDGRGESETGENFVRDERRNSTFDSEPMSKQARIGVQSSLT